MCVFFFEKISPTQKERESDQGSIKDTFGQTVCKLNMLAPFIMSSLLGFLSKLLLVVRVIFKVRST